MLSERIESQRLPLGLSARTPENADAPAVTDTCSRDVIDFADGHRDAVPKAEHEEKRA